MESLPMMIGRTREYHVLHLDGYFPPRATRGTQILHQVLDDEEEDANDGDDTEHDSSSSSSSSRTQAEASLSREEILMTRVHALLKEEFPAVEEKDLFEVFSECSSPWIVQEGFVTEPNTHCLSGDYDEPSSDNDDTLIAIAARYGVLEPMKIAEALKLYRMLFIGVYPKKTETGLYGWIRRLEEKLRWLHHHRSDGDSCNEDDSFVAHADADASNCKYT